ncbi:MAG: hypothetical protein ABIH82_02190 [Candidatus Woesearchaeota archaeon]
MKKVVINKSTITFLGFLTIALGGLVGSFLSNPGLGGVIIALGGFIVSLTYLLPK